MTCVYCWRVTVPWSGFFCFAHWCEANPDIKFERRLT